MRRRAQGLQGTNATSIFTIDITLIILQTAAEPGLTWRCLQKYECVLCETHTNYLCSSIPANLKHHVVSIPITLGYPRLSHL